MDENHHFIEFLYKFQGKSISTVARLPIDDSDKFCAWLLSEFEYEKQTVMMAPASGFYTMNNVGNNEVRVAYVLKKEDLEKALFILKKALEVYPGRTK